MLPLKLPGWSTIQKRTDETLAAFANVKSSALRKIVMPLELELVTSGVPLSKIMVAALAARADASNVSTLKFLIIFPGMHSGGRTI